VRFYEIDDSGGQKTEAKAKFDHRAAVLACSFSADATHAFSGGLDTVVKEYVDFCYVFIVQCSRYSQLEQIGFIN